MNFIYITSQILLTRFTLRSIVEASTIDQSSNKNLCDIVGIGRSVFKESDWMNRELKGLIKE